jgi:hypothetical protein
MRKKDNYQPSSFISVYLLVKIKIKVVYDHEKKAQVTTETYKTYIYVSGNNDLLLLMNSVFLFLFCLNKLTKVNFPNEHVQLSDLIIIHQLYIWYEGVHARLDDIVTLTRQSDLVTMI